MGQETGTRERGGQRLDPEREGARNWHWRKMGQETGNRERRGHRLALRVRRQETGAGGKGQERGRRSLCA